MYIRTSVRNTSLQQIAENPQADIVVSSDQQLPPELASETVFQVKKGVNLTRLSSRAFSNREKLIGKSIKLADLSLSAAEKTLLLSNMELPNGIDTVFSTAGFILSGADVYHSLKKDEPDAFEIVVATAKAITATADLLAPLVPVLHSYKPHFQIATILLKIVGTGNEMLELSCKQKELDSIGLFE